MHPSYHGTNVGTFQQFRLKLVGQGQAIKKSKVSPRLILTHASLREVDGHSDVDMQVQQAKGINYELDDLVNQGKIMHGHLNEKVQKEQEEQLNENVGRFHEGISVHGGKFYHDASK